MVLKSFNANCFNLKKIKFKFNKISIKKNLFETSLFAL